MQGHVQARHNLGHYEANKWGGPVFVPSKQQYAGALKGYRCVVDEIKSQERDEAKTVIEQQQNGKAEWSPIELFMISSPAFSSPILPFASTSCFPLSAC